MISAGRYEFGAFDLFSRFQGADADYLILIILPSITSCDAQGDVDSSDPDIKCLPDRLLDRRVTAIRSFQLEWNARKEWRLR